MFLETFWTLDNFLLRDRASCCCSYRFDLLPLLLGGDERPGDAQALLEHGHAGLGVAALDLGQSGFLLRLLVLQLLDQPLVVALHLLHLLKAGRQFVGVRAVIINKRARTMKRVQSCFDEVKAL